MNRFSLKNNFGWALFVLIFAAFSNAANVESESLSSRLPNDAKNVRVSVDAASASDAGIALLSNDAASLLDQIDRSSRGAARRVLGAERPARSEIFGGPSYFSTTNPRVFERDGFGVAYRSFWTCQTVSRPLFLLLLTLRN